MSEEFEERWIDLPPLPVAWSYTGEGSEYRTYYLCEATIHFPGFLELSLKAREEFMKLFKESLKEDGYVLELALEQGEIIWRIILPEEAED